MWMRSLFRLLVVVSLVLGVVAADSGLENSDVDFDHHGHDRLAGPSQSGPIALTPDDHFAWVVNPDVNTVSLLEVGGGANRKVAELRVGIEPRNVAISPDGRRVFVSNVGSGTVSVIRASKSHPRVVRTLEVGTEPYGMAFTPNGEKLYVANARSNNISVIDGDGERVRRTIERVGPEPRGIAITNDGDRHDDDETVLVTQFLAVDRPGVLIGRDDYKEGRVTLISTRDDKVIGQVTLNPMLDTGFRSNGAALAHIAPVDPPAFTVVTGAFPNMLNSVAIKGGRAYLPNTAASPDGPVRFNVNVQALLSVVDLASRAEGTAGGVSQTINMNRGINFEPPGATRLFVGVPWAIAFEHGSDVGWAVASASNFIVKVDLDEAGTPTIHAPAGAGQASGIVRILVGQNPRGIAIDSHDAHAYVANEVSRDVSVVDLASQAVVATIRSSDLPVAGTDEARLLLGKALFYSSTGVNLPELGPLGMLGTRLSSDGWSACVSCHPFGLTDGVVWIFGTGPRRTLPLNGSFNPHDPTDIKILNYSAVNDEIQDFEANIRGVSGGAGLITLADGTTADPILNSFAPPNTGRSERLDALALYVARGIRTPLSPLGGRGRSHEHGEESGRHDADEGRELFATANCAACHGGGGWASSRRDYTPPPVTTDVVGAQLKRLLRTVGTFDPTAANEIRQNGAAPLGADGFAPPSLLGAHALAPFLHNGSAASVLDVLANVAHRSAGTGGVDRLADPGDRERLARFVESIDARTKPFPIPTAAVTAAVPGGAVQLATPGARLDLALAGANPAGGGATFRYVLPGRGSASLELFDLQGRRLATLASGVAEAGAHEARWDGRLASGARANAGVYLARLDTRWGRRVVRIVRD
ncbi:MAG TPA: beta-propeller fold lactonase family protein [Candidatus Eisenbacteria bacterium]